MKNEPAVLAALKADQAVYLPQGAGEIGLGLPGHTGQFLSAVTTGRCFWLLGSGTTVQR